MNFRIFANKKITINENNNYNWRSKGIGRCLVEYFASQGDAVYFIDMDADAVATVTEKLCAKQMNVYGFTGDIADEQVLQKFAARVIEETPQGIHCLINNACLMKGGILSGCSYDDFLYVQRVGVAAPYLLSKLFMHHFAGVGSIVNLSSTVRFSHSPIQKLIRQPKEALPH